MFYVPIPVSRHVYKVLEEEAERVVRERMKNAAQDAADQDPAEAVKTIMRAFKRVDDDDLFGETPGGLKYRTLKPLK